MPLIDLAALGRDYFTWESINSGWAGNLAEALNDLLPQGYVAIESARFGQALEVDVGTLEDFRTGNAPSDNGSSTSILTWAPPHPARTLTTSIPDQFELKIFERKGSRLVAAIELISPSNKDRPEDRRAFTSKCASYLKDGVSLILVDTVTTRGFNLHHELMELFEQSELNNDLETAALYAVAYRPVKRRKKYQIDIWGQPLQIGEELPILPLRLVADLFVPVDLESTYTETCRRRRII